MKITCQSCESKYTVSDEKVQGKTVKIKCRKCGATIVVTATGVTMANGTSGASHEAAPPPSASADGPTYSVNVAENDQRTMTMAEIVAAYNQSVVTGDTYVWADGMADWMPLAQVEAIVLALNAAAAPPADDPPPAPAPYPDPAEEAPRAALRRDGARRDLFGGGGGLGAEAVAASAEPAGPPVGLFSAPAPIAPVASPAASPLGPSAAENSVMFSLSALTARAATPSSPGGKTTASKDDSGLIDLKALAERAAAAGPPAPVAASSVIDEGPGLFPLGAPIVAGPAPVLAAPSAPAPAASKTPMFIGIGIAVAGLAAAGIFMATRPKPLPPPPPVATQTAEAAPAPSAVAAAPSAEASAAPTAAEPGGSASAAPSASAVAKGGKLTGKLGKGKLPDKTSSASTPAPGPAPAPAPAAKSKCNCPPGDLMCNIKCSAGK